MGEKDRNKKRTNEREEDRRTDTEARRNGGREEERRVRSTKADRESLATMLITHRAQGRDNDGNGQKAKRDGREAKDELREERETSKQFKVCVGGEGER